MMDALYGQLGAHTGIQQAVGRAKRQTPETQFASTFGAKLEPALTALFTPQTAPLSEYVRWFSTYSKLPCEHVQKHPQFWDATLMTLFLSGRDAATQLGDDGVRGDNYRLVTD